MEDYPRFLTEGAKPFNPLELAEKTERIVTRLSGGGLKRKYTSFYTASVYGGIATGCAVGCCLRCFYCWSNWSRDFPEKYGVFYSPRQVALNLFKAARDCKQFRGVEKLRLSCCEPTIGFKHLIGVLTYIMDSDYPLFILESNGVILGSSRVYAKQLAEFKGKLYVRISFKAATPEGFTQRTGAIGSFYLLPFKALKYLLDEGVYVRAAAMTDERIMSRGERNLLIQMLDLIDPAANYAETLEEETLHPYNMSVNRMRAFKDRLFADKLVKKILRGG
ncbi:MAG: molybdenum cofactor biosynthesis protein MoaA [Candidatus Odinarchaeum yellowstonii]|uniref:Molybdenum cofactor biosynthesis protein MoaA n=1 Tax=Odinarchaeota yellowstonii (strain LCB_4) TaxID=1841599 RepID=A0AAF0IBC5_ODILC|nr:MAG: molybdenum cofactor biosynthesis protein MoaA [Candidatus Odinarchaeum yellowstonii]